ncbi:MAG: hypothetical protein WAL13_21875 [Trebonia sp.]|uniref:hypothetical protein n=1 Tax=Trebonia sp. TaxID=2767075 RepID=UPI003BDFDAE1
MVAGPVLLDVLRLQRVQPDHLAVPVVGGQQGQQAAIFIGWYLASITPSSSPTSIVNRIADSRTVRASRADGVNTSRSPPCRSC